MNIYGSMVCTCLKTSLVLSIALCARCILLYMVLLCGCCNICTGEVCPYTHARRIRLLLRRGRGGVFFVRASTTKGWVLGTTRDPRYLKSWSEGTQWSVIRIMRFSDQLVLGLAFNSNIIQARDAEWDTTLEKPPLPTQHSLICGPIIFIY